MIPSVAGYTANHTASRTRRRHLVLVILFTLLLAPGLSHAQWIQTSGPVGGSIPVLLVDGTDIYAGTYAAGVFKSTDAGVSWTRKGNGLPHQTIVAMVKAGGHIIASGTEGVYRSSDGGDSWTLAVDADPYGGVSTLATQGTHVIAGTGYGGVFASTDEGASWFPSNNGLPLADGEASVSASTTAGSSYLIFGQDFSSSGVFRSTDLGANWFAADAGIPAGDLITALFFDGATLFAAGTDVYRSDDLGGSWRAVETGIPSYAMIREFTTDGSVLLAGGAAGIFSTPSGDSAWTREAGLASETGVLSMEIVGAILFAGTAGDGVHRSVNGGLTWGGWNVGLRARNMSGLLADGGRLFGNGQSIFRTTDDGDTWDEVRGGLGDSAIAPSLLHVGGDTMFALDGSIFHRLVRSIDGGITWTEVWPELYNLGIVQSIVRTASGFWTAAGAIYRSTDGGVTWNSVDSAATSGWILFEVARLDGALYAHGQKIFRSTDDGASWQDVTPSSGSFTQADVMASVGSTIFAGDRWQGMIHRSTNGGASWSAVASPPGAFSIDQLLGWGTTLFACVDFDGVYRSTNGGTSWSDITAGLPPDQLGYRIGIRGGYLFAGLGGNSVWRRPLSEITAVGDESSHGIPAKTALLQNYPNPFNPTTTVSWTASSAGRMTVKIYDALGREVAALFDAVAQAGVHSAVWDATGAPGGVYYCRLTSGEGTDVRAMLLVR